MKLSNRWNVDTRYVLSLCKYPQRLASVWKSFPFRRLNAEGRHILGFGHGTGYWAQATGVFAFAVPPFFLPPFASSI